MTTTQPPALSYATPVRDRSFLAWYSIYLSMLGLPAIGAAWTVFILIPVFVNVYRDLRTTLPTVTIELIHLDSYCTLPFIWPLGVMALLIIPWFLARWTMRFRQRVERLALATIVLVVLCLVSMLAFLVVEATFALPFIKLIESISAGV